MGRARCRSARVPARRRDQRGNALVEAVIILPILMLLTFGGIELGIGFGQKGALESATRAGARKASTLTAVDGPTNKEFGDQTLPAVNAALDSTAVPKLEGLWIYKTCADSAVGCTDADPGDTPGSCNSGNCIAYIPDPGDPVHFAGPGSGTWPAGPQRNGCGLDADRVSVKIKGTFSFLTNLIGSGNITLHSTTTLQLEPTNCAS